MAASMKALPFLRHRLFTGNLGRCLVKTRWNGCENGSICVVQQLTRSYCAGGTDRKPTGRAVPTGVDEWKRLDWKAYAQGRERITLPDEPEFPVMLIPGQSPLPHKFGKRAKGFRQRRKKKPPRSASMPVDQEWASTWPAAHTFKWSVVPFPVRQGYVRRSENQGIPPGKYSNVELVKIPNFLHLSPDHIRQHCNAIKKFCTPWPKGLETEEDCESHFPVEVTTRDYVFDGPNLRDPRARLVTLKVKMSNLELDEHAKDKLIKLVGDRYNKKTDVLTLETDRCPMKKQNYDYTVYLLTALYHESWRTEAWETEQTEADMYEYEWHLTAARNNLVQVINTMKAVKQEKVEVRIPGDIEQLPEILSAEDLEKTEVVSGYRKALHNIHEHGEDVHYTEQYKKATKRLLLGL